MSETCLSLIGGVIMGENNNDYGGDFSYGDRSTNDTSIEIVMEDD
jgi:hypothetical protein